MEDQTGLRPSLEKTVLNVTSLAFNIRWLRCDSVVIVRYGQDILSSVWAYRLPDKATLTILVDLSCVSLGFSNELFEHLVDKKEIIGFQLFLLFLR